MGYATRFTISEERPDSVTQDLAYISAVRMTAARILAGDPSATVKDAVDKAEDLEEELEQRAVTSVDYLKVVAQADWEEAHKPPEEEEGGAV